MKTLTFWKEETEVWIEGNEDGNTETKLQWFCSDGIATFFGDTKAEAASHFGVPVGFDDVSSAASLLGRKGGLAKSERKTTTARENGKKGGRPGMYTVTLTDESGDTTSWPGLTKREAIRLAKETAAFNPTCAVFIEWHRKSDDQHGYLNPSGDHDLTGHVW